MERFRFVSVSFSLTKKKKKRRCKLVRPASLKTKHPIRVDPKLKNHIPFWETDCEKHLLKRILAPFYFRFVCKIYPFTHLCRFRYPIWVNRVTQHTPKRYFHSDFRVRMLTNSSTECPLHGSEYTYLNVLKSCNGAASWGNCLCHLRTTKAQISLHIRAVWSAPLLAAAWIL